MARTLISGFFPRAVCLFFLLLACSSFQSTADEMTSSILIANSRIDVTVEPGALQAPSKEMLHWVQSAAESVAVYYGRFPVPRLSIHISPFLGRGVRNGMTFGDHGGRITIRVGDETSAAELASDWMMTHEMVHLAFPSVPQNHHWIEEGIATYVEPIARIRAGHLSVNQMWFDLVRDMPQGLPREGDRGLDHTHTWGRTYWGGALFCFLADIEIRRKTHNTKGLEHALRGILESGADIREDGNLENALRVGDRAVGVKVLEPLYNKMKDAPVDVDLDALWTQLGIQTTNNTVRLDDRAKLAAIRRGITAAEASSQEQKALPAKPVAAFAGRSARTTEPLRANR
jgi:hypothetical protein